MRSNNRLGFWLALGVAAGCSSGTDALLSVRVPGSVTLKVSGAATIVGTPWTLQFDSVVSDSRCPLGVFCIQAGEAVLALSLASPLADVSPQDSPHFTLGATPVKVEGLRFSQVEVSPIPRLNVTIDPKSYVATIMIDSGPP